MVGSCTAAFSAVGERRRPQHDGMDLLQLGWKYPLILEMKDTYNLLIVVIAV